MTEVLPVETSDHWKSAGNDFYKVKNYPGAVTAYGKAIDLDPSNALLFTNRAAAHLMLMQYREASVDCDAAIKLDQTCSKAYFRKATALKGLGRLEPAIDALNKGLEHDPSSSTAFQEKASLVGAKDKMAAIRALLKRKSYTAALVQTDALIKEIGSAFPEVSMLRSECLLCLGREQEAFNMTNLLMKAGLGSDPALLSLRAKCLLVMGDVDNSFKHLQQAVRSDPDNLTIRAFYRSIREILENKTQGDDLFKSQSFADAVERYSASITAILSLDTPCAKFTAKLFLNRATCQHKLKKQEEGIKDCNQAIYHQAGYYKAYLRRAECYLALGGPINIEKAIRDMEEAKEMENDDEESAKTLDSKIKKAKVLLKRSKRKDLYSVLGLTPEASESEIKSAYRKCALKYHPDKQSSKSDAEKAEAEAKFKEVGEAYDVLSNPEKKERYDEGVDLEDLENPHAGHSHEEMDPSMLFHMFMQQQRGGHGGFR